MAQATTFSRLLGGNNTNDANALMAEDSVVNVLTARTYQEKQRTDAEEADEASASDDIPSRDHGEPLDPSLMDDTTTSLSMSPKDDPALLDHIETLEALEFTSDVFGASSSLRNDTLVLIKTMASSLAIVIALKHTSILTKANQINAFVAAVLIFLVYVISQLSYYINHWLKWTNLQKRRAGKAYTMASFERTEIEEAKDALETLWGVRVATGELVACVARDALYLANTYITFILIAVLLEQINANFADGQFIFEKLIELVILVLLLFAGFACTNYRRDILLKPYRL